MLYDGCPVVYTGVTDSLLGAQGAVLIVDGRAAHVQWKTGSLAPHVSLVDAGDLEPLESRHGAVEAALDDSLEVAGLGTFTARQIFEDGGPEALLNAMVESGHLASFTPIAEEALELVMGRLRTSAALQGVTAHLDPEDTEELVRTAAAVLIRDAFTQD